MDSHIARVNTLKSEYLLCQKLVEKVDFKIEIEKKKLNDILILRDDSQAKLSELQEEIDCDPNPESIQPLSRIQKRDLYTLVRKRFSVQYLLLMMLIYLQQVSQYDYALKAQQETVDKLLDEQNESEKKLFQADKKLNAYVESIDDTRLVVSLQDELTKER